MKLFNYKLGSLIQQVNEKNNDLKYDINNVKGISIKKVFIETKADMSGVSLKPYLIVSPERFAYVPITSRNSNKITLGFNNTEETYMVSSSYIVFEVKDKEILDPEYLYIYFNRPEFDRYARFNSWGSAREAFSWEDMCDINITLPSIDIQRKYVSIYKMIMKNIEIYENNIDDLNNVSLYYIENLKKEKGTEKIGNNIIEVSEKNAEGIYKKEMGISIEKKFISTKAHSSDVKNQKIVYKNHFAFNSNTSRNSDKLSIALNKEEPCLVSNTYITFKCNEDVLIPDYLLLWFRRSEFDRYARFNSWGSARETIGLEDIKNYEISIPSIAEQQSIIKIYESYFNRKQILERLKNIAKDICPILIKGSLEEASNE